MAGCGEKYDNYCKQATHGVFDNVQMAVFMSAESAQNVQILQLKHKQTSGIPFEGRTYCIAAVLSVYLPSCHCPEHRRKSPKMQQHCHMITSLLLLTSLISEIGHTSGKGYPYSKIF